MSRILACAWAVAFGVVSLYWGFGGDVGLDTLSTDIERDAQAGGAKLIALGVAAGVLKLGLATLPVVRPRRPVILLCWLAGGAMTLYGLATTVEKALMKLDVVDQADSIPGERLDWYLFLWDPLWLLGGVLFLLLVARGSRPSA